MPEVDDARVIISENNAYVAVRLADNNDENNGMLQSMMHWMATAGLLPRMDEWTRMTAVMEMMESLTAKVMQEMGTAKTLATQLATMFLTMIMVTAMET